jgi:hypothetical protein
MATETQYKVYCNEEEKYVTAWYSTRPLCCPNNYRHSIDPLKTVKLASRPVDAALVRVQEENTLTNGNFRYQSFTFTCGSNCTTSNDISFPYPINILTTQTSSMENMIGDTLDVILIPKNPIVGVTLSNLSVGSSNIYVSNSVLNYMNAGYLCIVGNENLGEVYNINPNSNMITTQYAASNEVAAASTVAINVHVIKNAQFIQPTTYMVGGGKIGASYIPAGAVLRSFYKNNSSNVKDFQMNLEFLY